MVPDIRVSPRVRAVLGADATAQALAVSLTAARCAVCQDIIGAAGPATVVVTLRGTVKHVRYAHPSCTPPTVVENGDPLELPADGLDMEMTAGLIRHGNTDLPVLLAELSSPVFAQDTHGATTNMLASGLLERGFALVGRIREAPRKIPGWTANLTGDQLRITDPDDTPFYTGDINLPPGWLEATTRYRWCVLYTGGIAVDDTATPDAVVTMLRATASAG